MFYNLGRVQKVQTLIPSKVGSLGNSLAEPAGCRGRRAEAHGRWSRTQMEAKREWRLSRVTGGCVLSW